MSYITAQDIVLHCIADNFQDVIGFDPYDPSIDDTELDHALHVANVALTRPELATVTSVAITDPNADTLSNIAYNVLLELYEEGTL